MAILLVLGFLIIVFYLSKIEKGVRQPKESVEEYLFNHVANTMGPKIDKALEEADEVARKNGLQD